MTTSIHKTAATKPTASLPRPDSTMTITMPVSAIHVDNRMREADDAKVKEIAESMAEIGLLHPIVINTSNKLVAGLTRLKAAKLLGWSNVMCTVVKLGGIDLELAEIDENLKRSELHYTEQSVSAKRRKEIYEIKHPETTHAEKAKKNLKQNNTAGSAESALPERPEIKVDAVIPASFVKDTAKVTGKSERAISELVQIGNNVIPEAMHLLKDGDIPKCDAVILARETPEIQKKIIDKVKAQTNGRKSIPRAKREVEHEMAPAKPKAAALNIPCCNKAGISPGNVENVAGILVVPEGQGDRKAAAGVARSPGNTCVGCTQKETIVCDLCTKPEKSITPAPQPDAPNIPSAKASSPVMSTTHSAVKTGEGIASVVADATDASFRDFQAAMLERVKHATAWHDGKDVAFIAGELDQQANRGDWVGVATNAMFLDILKYKREGVMPSNTKELGSF